MILPICATGPLIARAPKDEHEEVHQVPFGEKCKKEHERGSAEAKVETEMVNECEVHIAIEHQAQDD